MPVRRGEGDSGICDGARHLPSKRTARGENRTAAIAPWRKMAPISPLGNLFDRKNRESIWLPTVALPYMPTNMAPTSRQPYQPDRRIMYDTTTPAHREKNRNAFVGFSTACGDGVG